MAALAPSALILFCNSLLFISLFTRMPAIQAGLGIDKAMLGLALLGMPIGTFLALPLASRVVERLTPRRAAALMLALAALIEPLFPIMPFYGFAASLIAFTFVRTILDVSANILISQTEKRTGKRIMARSHGFWSVGLLVGSAFSGWVAGMGVSPGIHLAGMGGVSLLAAALLLVITPQTPQEGGEGRRRGIFVVPSRAILLICIMIFGMAISEGAIYDWGMFLIRERISADPAIAGLLYACFTVGMGVTRMLGDHLRGRFSPPAIVRGSALAAMVGIFWTVNADGLAGAAFALALTGCGVALIAPLAFSTALALPGKGQADNLAALSMSMLIATLGVPPLLGFVAEHWGMGRAFLLLLPFIGLTFLMAPVASGRAIRRD